MNVLVVGSTGGSGRAAVAHLLAAGHEVTAFSRSGARPDIPFERLRVFAGDAMNPDHVERAVRGHDAVVVTLGIRENPLRVRLRGPVGTPIDVRSAGTRNVIAAMRKHGVRRLVVQTTHGVGESRDRLGLVDRLFFALLLAPQIADTERQEAEVRASELDWVLVQPVHLTDEDDGEAIPFVSTSGETGGMRVSRHCVGRVLAEAVTNDAYLRRSVAVSAPERTLSSHRVAAGPTERLHRG